MPSYSQVRVSNGLYSQHVDGFESAAEHRLAGPAEPAFEQRRVNLAKVRVKFDVAVFQLVEVGMFADKPGSHAGSGEKHRRGGAVISSLTGVFCYAPAELAECHCDRAFAVAVMLHIVDERTHRIAELL